ncbi:MAG: hypothetical protein IKI54_02220 [Lachnospiraceae bacterium]|nr:hypothetical protein [Lachnospiraceae bacterium]
MAGLFRFTAEYEGEELDSPSSGRRRRKAPKGLLAVFVMLLTLGILMIGAYLLRIEHVTITGNHYCNDEIVMSKVFKSEDDYKLSSVLYKMFFGVENDGAFESIRISLTGLQSAAIRVSETKGIAQVHFSNEYVFFNENGIVIGNLPVRDNDMLLLDGTFFTAYTDFEFPETDAPDALLDALKVAKGAQETGLFPDPIRCEDGTYTLDFQDVQVKIGTSAALSAKLKEITYQMPNYSGLKGILHMEDYDGTQENPYFYFEVLNSR